ncbi:MAG: hypothetical protein ACYC21_06500 [Eubacteriales bacterium]
MIKSQYKQLLSQVTVGAFELRNRIVFGAHPTNFAREMYLPNSMQHIIAKGPKAGSG